MTNDARTVSASASGRVNLMGDHTDYNEGFVLPMLIPQTTHVTVRLHDGPDIDARSATMSEVASYRLGEERLRGSWIDFVQGVTYVLQRAGHALRGFSLEIASTVPIGAGLSSSAALEIAILRALREAFDLPLDDLQLARFGRAVEVDFIDVPIGIMDQLVACLGKAGEALWVDTRSLATLPVPIPAAIEVGVIDSGVPHDHSQNEYRTRRQECEAAAAALGVRSLRELADRDEMQIAALKGTLRRRVRHVIHENARVQQLKAAFEQCDLEAMRDAFQSSHASLRDDYEVSTPEIDRLIEIAMQVPSVIGARLTGGGFGGSIVLLAHANTAAQATERIAREYAAVSGRQPRVLLPVQKG
jgi:galactokinase